MSEVNNQEKTQNKITEQQAEKAEVVKSSSAVDVVLWIVAIALLLASAVVNQYLPQYVEAASNVWVRVAVIVGCVLVALGLLYATRQGKNFIQLVKDSRLELRRVTWPTKQETVTATWQVSVVIIITSLILWGFDSVLSVLIKLIIG